MPDPARPHFVDKALARPVIRFALVQEGARRPERGSDGAAGFDVSTPHGFGLSPGSKVIAWSGVSVAVPDGFVGILSPRSRLARLGLVLLGPGIIDSDYRGEIGIPLMNMSDRRVEVEAGDRLAQLVVVPCLTESALVGADELGVTERGAGGFGSTGR